MQKFAILEIGLITVMAVSAIDFAEARGICSTGEYGSCVKCCNSQGWDSERSAACRYQCRDFKRSDLSSLLGQQKRPMTLWVKRG